MAVELAEVVRRLREDLAEAMAAGQDEELRFELGPIELELTVAVRKEARPGAKVKFWVVELGTDVTAASDSTQRIKLTLTPRMRGQPGRAPDISGDQVSGER